MQNIIILYGTETGNAEYCSYKLEDAIKEQGMVAKVYDMDSYQHKNISTEDLVIIITSTHGDGDPPHNAQDFMDYLSNKRPSLKNVKFAVCGLGDTAYPNFAQAGKDFDILLGKLGGKRVIDRVDCDINYEEKFSEFRNNIMLYIKG